MREIGDILGKIEAKVAKPKRAGDMERSTSDERAKRLLDAAEAIRCEPEPDTILFQHSVLCQTTLPYRNPGESVRSWERVNGSVHLKLKAGEALHPELGRLVEIGLPYGTKPRLILAHLNTEALRYGSPEIEVESSLTSFVKRLQLSNSGRNISVIKDQLARLAASHITLGIMNGGEAITINSQIVTAFNIWFPKDGEQRVLWPSKVKLSQEYFNSLTKHAVPLDDRALMALSGSAMALDVYAWLAQRLHRIERGKRTFIPWTALKAQFGWHYKRLIDFRPEFRKTLRDVHSQYRAADVELDRRGMTLRHSPPPVRGRTGIVVQIP